MTQDFSKTLGKRIRQIRKNRGYTQEGLADLVGTSQGHLGKVERGEVQVGTEMLQKLATALTVEVGHFFHGPKNIPREILMQRTTSMLERASDKDLHLIFKIVDSIVN